METAERAVALNPLRPPYYYLFNAMILWGNERYQEALEESEACLRMAPNFAGADTYRAMALVGLGRLEEARAQLARCMARPGGIVIVPPHPPELASRSFAALKAAGWRPSASCRPRGSLSLLNRPTAHFRKFQRSVGTRTKPDPRLHHGAGPRLSCPLGWTFGTPTRSPIAAPVAREVNAMMKKLSNALVIVLVRWPRSDLHVRPSALAEQGQGAPAASTPTYREARCAAHSGSGRPCADPERSRRDQHQSRRSCYDGFPGERPGSRRPPPGRRGLSKAM